MRRSRIHLPRVAAATVLTLLTSALIAVLATLASHPTDAIGANLDQLNSQLGATQAQEGSLSTSLAGIRAEIGRLDGQITLVRQREAAVQAQLQQDRQHLYAAQTREQQEKAVLAKLKRILARAETALRDQVVSQYENGQPSLITVVVNSSGFSQLLSQLSYLDQAKNQQQAVIEVTRVAKRKALAATDELARLEQHDQELTAAAATEASALQGMNGLLTSKEDALSHAQQAQQAALDAARARGAQLTQAINKIKAEQAAAAAAAAAQAAQSDQGGTSAAPSGGWAIPAAIVMCESGGQNLPPNSAGASGYYQIMPATWAGEGGTGPAAYLASEAEQSAIAAKLWNNGAGASNWVCAGIVGIT